MSEAKKNKIEARIEALEEKQDIILERVEERARKDCRLDEYMTDQQKKIYAKLKGKAKKDFEFEVRDDFCSDGRLGNYYTDSEREKYDILSDKIEQLANLIDAYYDQE